MASNSGLARPAALAAPKSIRSPLLAGRLRFALDRWASLLPSSLSLRCGVKKDTAIAVVHVCAEAVWLRDARPYPLPAQERRLRAVLSEGIRCCNARRELHPRPGLEAWAYGAALNAPLPRRVGSEKEDTMTVAEACKLLSTLPDGAQLRWGPVAERAVWTRLVVVAAPSAGCCWRPLTWSPRLSRTGRE